MSSKRKTQREPQTPETATTEPQMPTPTATMSANTVDIGRHPMTHEAYELFKAMGGNSRQNVLDFGNLRDLALHQGRQIDEAQLRTISAPDDSADELVDTLHQMICIVCEKKFTPSKWGFIRPDGTLATREDGTTHYCGNFVALYVQGELKPVALCGSWRDRDSCLEATRRAGREGQKPLPAQTYADCAAKVAAINDKKAEEKAARERKGDKINELFGKPRKPQSVAGSKYGSTWQRGS